MFFTYTKDITVGKEVIRGLKVATDKAGEGKGASWAKSKADRDVITKYRDALKTVYVSYIGKIVKVYHLSL